MPVIKLKSNTVASTVPTTGQLELGEVAINTYDGVDAYLLKKMEFSLMETTYNIGYDHKLK